MGTITLSDKQQRRAEILGRAAAGILSAEQTAQLLGVTDRQVRRLLSRFKAEGIKSVVHANTGRSPINKTPAVVRQKLLELAGEQGLYHDFNTCHLQELLIEREGLQLGRSTLDRLLKEGGVRKRRRDRPRRIYQRRERMASEGEMLLTDASPHDWLEGRDALFPRLCLLGSIDDATGAIKHLRFWPTECLAGYLTMAREVSFQFGLPMSFYHDRHTILCSPKEPTLEDELSGRKPQSQFEAVLESLGVGAIKALSPQAKGRIERLWQTLQDRLRKEMRLAGVSSLAGANAFLEAFIARYNARFAVLARNPEPAWVTLQEELDPAYYFAAKLQRTVREDHTLSFGGQLLQIKRRRGEPSLANKRVNVHTTPEGERFVYLGRRQLEWELCHPKPQPRPQIAKTAKQNPPQPERKPSENPGSRAWLFANRA